MASLTMDQNQADKPREAQTRAAGDGWAEDGRRMGKLGV